jgi:hypothetical protein
MAAVYDRQCSACCCLAPFPPPHPLRKRSCLQLLVCVLNLLLASSTFTEQQLQELQQQSPAAIGASGRFCTLKALSQEAKVDFANTQVWLCVQLCSLGLGRGCWGPHNRG